jgi:hypothetical protein
MLIWCLQGGGPRRICVIYQITLYRIFWKWHVRNNICCVPQDLIFPNILEQSPSWEADIISADPESSRWFTAVFTRTRSDVAHCSPHSLPSLSAHQQSLVYTPAVSCLHTQQSLVCTPSSLLSAHQQSLVCTPSSLLSAHPAVSCLHTQQSVCTPAVSCRQGFRQTFVYFWSPLCVLHVLPLPFFILPIW